ncbi:23S rRNA (guanosine(2251)-2'-O)-methyltransferase RlmB [Bdellovibrio sp. HCB337]|uniref:23S rRNA (guanosine(2251)-2'-O)-methyltransferase RlmB n=1 Tax=Bdellovibrio sp. HCB337 TaxID=3394358 RepID=UPI0039A66692
MKKNNSKFGGKSSQSQRPQQGGKPPQRGGAPQKGAPAQRGGGGRELEIPKEWRPVIGTHAIKEALKVHPKMGKILWLRQGWESSADLREIQELTQAARIKIDNKPESVIDRFGSSHQGAVLFMNGAPTLSVDGLENFEKSILLILDGIEDPHNLGAILRTSWLIGVQGVLVPEDRAVGLTPTVHKVACGGAEHVPVVETTNFTNYAEDFKKMGYWIYGLSPRGKKSIFELDLPEKVVWAIGSEDKGMRVNTERLCDELVYIPQSSAAASYNASVATAMALTETLRQHQNSKPRKK